MIVYPLSLRNKLLVFAAVLVVALGSLLAALAERNGRRSLENVIGHQLAREAGHTAGRLSALIQSERKMLENFAHQEIMREIRVADLDKRIAQALSTLVTGSEMRAGYLVADHEGWIMASSDPAWLVEPPAWTSMQVDANQRPKLIVLPDGRNYLLIAAPIADPDRAGGRLGTLFGVLDWSRLTEVLDIVREELSGQNLEARLAIVDEQGSLLRLSGRPSEERLDVSAFLRFASDLGRLPDYRVDSEEGMIVGRAEVMAGSKRWGLFVIEPLSHALAPAMRLRNRLGLTTLIVLGIALFIAVIGARRVVQPLTELTHAILEISRGDSARTAVPVRSEDEVGTLARAFNRMAGELDETQRHLVEAEKFAFVGELAAGVAHEVRTSLGVLRSSAQIIDRTLASEADPSVHEMISMIGAEVDRLGGVVDDLLTLDRGRPLDLRSTPLSAPLVAAIEFVERQATDKGIEIARRFCSPDPVVACDAEAIQQVCVNLLSNAIAALDSGQRIEVTTSSSEPSMNPQQSGEMNGNRSEFAVFSIRDTGGGIAEDLAKRIFDPFVTGRSDGVGLGLTIVKRVVHGHHGAVRLVPTVEGARFDVELPLWNGGGN